MAMLGAEPRLMLTDVPGDQAQTVIRDGLAAYNLQQAGYRDARPLAVLVSDPETQQAIGGLLGRTSMGLLFVDVFFLPEGLRKHRLGSQIIKMGKMKRSGAVAPASF
jgi:hypothetical protein